jgi:hypothetical protein
VYSRSALSSFEEALREGRLAVRVALEGLDVRVVTEPEWRPVDPDGRFAENVNRPEDGGGFVERPPRN